jgi:hypothetical protein
VRRGWEMQADGTIRPLDAREANTEGVPVASPTPLGARSAPCRSFWHRLAADNAMSAKLPFSSVLCCLLVACNAPVPTSSVPGTPVAMAAMAPPPPVAVRRSLANNEIGFRPLTASEVREVRVSADFAKQTALSLPGMGYGPSGDEVIWKKVSCVFLGWYTGPQQPSRDYFPPTHPAYLVQLLADPAPGFPMANVGVTVIDARTGETGTHYEGGMPPFGIMGTTCGVSP